ncbi:hypothetical protein CL634_06845 [bacterium]|nr:hypothetical protein [bacterium]
METKTKSVKCCETCLYMATHEPACNDCLGDDVNNFQYKNYKEGNWMARVEQFELAGKQNIVIGGQGEAEVNTRWTPEKTSRQLHYVAGQCGYMCSGLSRLANGKYKSLKIYTSDGYYSLNWENDKLKSIFILNQDGKVVGTFWNADKIQARMNLRKENNF